MVEVVTGGASIGQGFETVMAQVAAETIGVDYRPRARHPRPDRPHRLRHRRPCLARDGDDRLGDPGRRAQAARQGARHGGAADAGRAGRPRHRRRRRACGKRRAAPRSRSAPSRPRCCRRSPRATAASPASRAEGWFHTEHQVYPYGSHLAVVKVDRDTGGVTVERYVIGYDIGRAINPMLVEGPDRRRLHPRARRRADGGFLLQRARRAAVP